MTITYTKADKAHSSDGTNSGIIGLLKVCKSDFSKGLAEVKPAEESAISTNEIEKPTKEQAGLDKSIAELGSDKKWF